MQPYIFLNKEDLLKRMAKDNKIMMPSSGAGITQYFDDYHSKIVFEPMHVIIFAIIVIILELLLWIAF